MKQFKDKDLILWAKLKNGNVDALGDLYDLFIDDLFCYGIQFSNDKNHIMDSIHDLFLNLYKYRKKLASTDNVKYYLFRSLKNQILKKPKDRFLPLPFESNESLHRNNYVTSIEDQIIADEYSIERTYNLSCAMNSLSKKQRQSLFLRFTEGMHYEEIAETMNVTVQTSRTIIYRAIKVLRKNLTILTISIIHIFY